MNILIIDGIEYKTGLVNLGLGFLLQYIRDKYKIRVTARAYHSDEEIIDIAKDFDVFGFSCLTSQYLDCLNLATRLKNKYPHVPVVFGGIHPTSMPYEVISNLCVDYICIGEAEISFGSLLESVSSKCDDVSLVPGICYRTDNNKVNTTDCKVLDDIDAAGIPALDLLEYDKESLKVNVITSRACPFTCTYCYNSTMREKFKHKYRRRSVTSVIEECSYHKSSNKSYIAFSDDLFLFDEEWLNEFADQYGKKIGIPFGITARPEAVLKHEGSLRALKKVGLFDVWIGIESGNERIRRDILNRRMKNDDIIAAFKKMHNLGLISKSYNIMGIPTEGFGDIMDTFLINLKCRPDHTSCYTLIPYPGTKILKMAETMGLMESTNYSDSGNMQSDDRMDLGMLNTGRLSRHQIMAMRYLWKVVFHYRWVRIDKKFSALLHFILSFIKGTFIYPLKKKITVQGE